MVGDRCAPALNSTVLGLRNPRERGVGQRSATQTRTPRTTEITEITERIPGRSVRGIHADPRPFEPLDQLTDVDLILLGRVSLLRILLSVISVLSVVLRSSYFPESSPRLSAPARPCGRGRLARFSLPQTICGLVGRAPWPILPVPAVLLARCQVIDSKDPSKREPTRRYNRHRRSRLPGQSKTPCRFTTGPASMRACSMPSTTAGSATCLAR